MTENTIQTQNTESKFSKFKFILHWVSLLATVFLTAAALTCIFKWFAYGQSWDISGFLFSVLLAIIVYKFSLLPENVASVKKRAFIAIGALIIWAVCLPIIFKFFNFPYI